MRRILNPSPPTRRPGRLRRGRGAFGSGRPHAVVLLEDALLHALAVSRLSGCATSLNLAVLLPLRGHRDEEPVGPLDHLQIGHEESSRRGRSTRTPSVSPRRRERL
jgi:hypothetical protein